MTKDLSRYPLGFSPDVNPQRRESSLYEGKHWTLGRPSFSRFFVGQKRREEQYSRDGDEG